MSNLKVRKRDLEIPDAPIAKPGVPPVVMEYVQTAMESLVDAVNGQCNDVAQRIDLKSKVRPTYDFDISYDEFDRVTKITAKPRMN